MMEFTNEGDKKICNVIKDGSWVSSGLLYEVQDGKQIIGYPSNLVYVWLIEVSKWIGVAKTQDVVLLLFATSYIRCNSHNWF